MPLHVLVLTCYKTFCKIISSSFVAEYIDVFLSLPQLMYHSCIFLTIVCKVNNVVISFCINFQDSLSNDRTSPSLLNNINNFESVLLSNKLNEIEKANENQSNDIFDAMDVVSFYKYYCNK